LTQDRDDLRLSVSACLHAKSPHASCRENSTYAAPYFRGGLPMHRRAANMFHALVFKMFGQIASDVRRAIVAEQARFVHNLGAVAA